MLRGEVNCSKLSVVPQEVGNNHTHLEGWDSKHQQDTHQGHQDQVIKEDPRQSLVIMESIAEKKAQRALSNIQMIFLKILKVSLVGFQELAQINLKLRANF